MTLLGQSMLHPDASGMKHRTRETHENHLGFVSDGQGQTSEPFNNVLTELLSAGSMARIAGAAPRFCLTNSGTGILPVCKSEDDGLEARPTKNEEHSLDPSDRT